MKIFGGRANFPLVKQVCEHLKQTPGKLQITNFPDSEIFCKVDEDIRGRDVFLIQPTCAPVNENLMELLILLDCFRRASAKRITVVIPYFGYARQDRKDEGRVPITSKLAANLITRAGADRVLAMDLHAEQIQGFFDIPVDHLYALPVMNAYFKSLKIPPEELVLVSPDEGSIKRVLKHQRGLLCDLAIVDKRRADAHETKQANLIGASVKDRTAILLDDMISTGGSICGAARMVKDAGAAKIYVAVSHGVLCGDAVKKLNAAPIDEVVITDSIPLLPERTPERVRVLSIAPLLGEAIRRIHFNESISCLFQSHPIFEVK